MWAFTSFIAVLLHLNGVSCACDATYGEPGRTHCYYVTEQTLSRDDADTYCYDVHGGSVLTVTSQQEQDAILNLMMNRSLPSVWLGLKEIFTTWQWLDGRETTQQGCFNDAPDSYEFRERNVIENNTYEACIAKCKDKGYLYAAPQNGRFCWCGDSFGQYGHSMECNVLCPGNREQECGGSSQNQVLAIDGTYSNWLPGQPNNHLDYQSCAVMDPDEGGRWLDTKCSDRMATLCVIQNTTECTRLQADHSATEHISDINANNHCYYVNTDHITWSVAHALCQSLHGDFAFIDDAMISEEMMDFFNDAQPDIGNAEGLWIGLQRSRWWWSTGEEMGFTDWGSGEPNSAAQHCVLMNQLNGWQDQDCAGPFPTICETDSAINYHTTTAAPTTTATTATTTTTPTSTTTTVKQKVRKNPRVHSSEKELKDEHLASIVAGGVLMIVIILVVTTVACVVRARNKRKRKEEKKEAKREKYFFGFDGGDIGDTTMERKNREKAVRQKHASKDGTPPDKNPAQGGVVETVVGIETNEKDGYLNYENPSFQNDSDITGENRSDIKRLSDKPDVVPD